MKQRLLLEDRGLGTAYERYCFYQLMDSWATQFDVASVLEGPVDGMAGVSGVHAVGLARRGITVTSAVPSEEHARVARSIYSSCNAPASVVVASEDDVEALPSADMVLCYHAFELVKDWRSYLKRVATKARKLLVVAVCNPDNWGVALSRSAGKLFGVPDMDSPEAWYAETLSPLLWEVGRVKEHTYFDCPWWPDVKILQVAPGLPFKDRVRAMLGRKVDAAASAAPEPVTGPGRFVFDGARWPYFGGPGWMDELLPALLKHPCFEGARSKQVRARSAHLHAFVVDMRPRTPKEKRRLARLDATSDKKLP